MDLSPELFDQIVVATSGTLADAKASDRRSPRARTATPLAVCPWADPMAVLSLKVRDLSAGGVGLLHRERMALDEKVVIRLPTPAGESITVLGKVVYWEPLAPELFAIGVQFDRVVTEAELTRQAAAAEATVEDAESVMGRLSQALPWNWRRPSPERSGAAA